MTGMTPERLLEIGNRLPGAVYPGTVERDVLDLLDEVMRLRAIEKLHGPVQEFEPCPTEWKGCDDPACTESAHDGDLYHADQPTGRVCLTCRDEDGAPRDWPCATAALLNPTDEPRYAPNQN